MHQPRKRMPALLWAGGGADVGNDDLRSGQKLDQGRGQRGPVRRPNSAVEALQGRGQLSGQFHGYLAIGLQIAFNYVRSSIRKQSFKTMPPRSAFGNPSETRGRRPLLWAMVVFAAL